MRTDELVCASCRYALISCFDAHVGYACRPGFGSRLGHASLRAARWCGCRFLTADIYPDFHFGAHVYAWADVHSYTRLHSNTHNHAGANGDVRLCSGRKGHRVGRYHPCLANVE